MRPRASAATALVAALATVSAGCAGRAWPSTYNAAADPGFAKQQRPIRTVDILPVDLEVWANAERATEAERVRAGASGAAVGAATAALFRRGYAVTSVIDWDGGGGPAGAPHVMTAAGVLATVGALASYGAAATHSDGLPVPFLPVRLGAVSGADATLYVGGWSYLGEPPDDGSDAGKGVLIALGIIAAVVVVAVAADALSSKSKGGKGRGGGHGSHGGGRRGGSLPGNAARAIGHAASASGRVALRTVGRVGSLGVQIGRGAAHATADIASATVRGLSHPAYVTGRAHTHIEILAPSPLPAPCPEVGCAPPPPMTPALACASGDPSCTVSAWQPPPDDGPSSMYLEMTLVDNRTGYVLWHARQHFPADGARGKDVVRAAGGLLSTLPKAAPN
jgi:hypothetical protein